jgi:hypothetical protein
MTPEEAKDLLEKWFGHLTYVLHLKRGKRKANYQRLLGEYKALLEFIDRKK